MASANERGIYAPRCKEISHGERTQIQLPCRVIALAAGSNLPSRDFSLSGQAGIVFRQDVVDVVQFDRHHAGLGVGEINGKRACLNLDPFTVVSAIPEVVDSKILRASVADRKSWSIAGHAEF